MYDQKIKSARESIEAHNSNVENKIDFDTFLEKLQNLGGTSEETLAACSYEDLGECGLPIILAKMISRIFRQKNGEGSSKSSYVSSRKAEVMTISELLERYNPRDSHNAVGDRLNKLSNKENCIVFTESGTVNVEVSVNLLNAIIDGHDRITSTIVEEKVFQVYKIGDKPDIYVNLNPFYDKPLRPGDICSKTLRSWKGISDVVRHIIHIAFKNTGEIKMADIDTIHTIMDYAEKKYAETYFRMKYPRASLTYDELVKTNSLPSLKIKLSTSRAIDNKNNDCFYPNKTY